MGIFSKIGSKIVKEYASDVASRSKRGAEKEAIKSTKKAEGKDDLQAANAAHMETRKKQNNPVALQKTDTRQDKATSKFISKEEGKGNKSLGIEAKKTGVKEGDKPGQFTSIKKKAPAGTKKSSVERDDSTTQRATQNRLSLREKGEKVYIGGLKEAAKSDAKFAAKAALGTAAVVDTADYVRNKKDKENKDKENKAKENKPVVQTLYKGGMPKKPAKKGKK